MFQISAFSTLLSFFLRHHLSSIRGNTRKCDMFIKGTTALVTGAAKGIGLECVKAFLKNGAQNVAVCDVDVRNGENAVRELQKEYGADRVMFIKTDVANMAQLEEAFKKTQTTFKALDIVINNAGILEDSRWEQEIAVNVNAVVKGTLLGLQFMGKDEGGKGGVVVNVSSIGGLVVYPGCPVYIATRHAVIGLTRSFGLPYHFDRTGVRVMAMCPGATDTAMISEVSGRMLRKEWSDEFKRGVIQLPQQKPESVAEGMIHMIEKGSSGSLWLVEGGQPVYEIRIPDRQSMRVE